MRAWMRNGRYLLLGSVSLSLVAGVSESLAGRVGFVDMSPLSLLEAAPDRLDALWLYGQPWLDKSWEGFVIEQIVAAMNIKNLPATPYYFRSSDGYELDLLLDWGNERWAIEIKLASNPSKQEIERLNKVADMVGATRRILLCRVATPFGNDQLTVSHPTDWLQQL
jgi:predicted AAA+ superfamily ATPase